MKKVLSIALSGLLLFGLTGCGDDTDKTDKDSSKSNQKAENVLTCSGDYSLYFETGISCSSGGECRYSFANDPDIRGIFDTEYTFTFKDNKIDKVEGQEIATKEASDEMISELDPDELDEALAESNAYINDAGRVVFDYSYGADDELISLINEDIESKEDLKELLEDKTTLTCK